MIKEMRFIKRLFSRIGPGFITGAADDDPSGIATYSIAGARYGYGLNFLTLFLIPAMIAVQEMCGRLGMITGMGLTSLIKKYFSVYWMWFAVVLLACANVINIGANLGVMGESLEMVIGFDKKIWLGVVAVGIILIEVFVPYKRYSAVLKWLSLSLLAYVVTGLMISNNWGEALKSLFLIKPVWSEDWLMTVVGFLGTTISPYLFFWQTSEEVEEEIADKKIVDFGVRPEVSRREIRKMRLDTAIGMIFSNLMTFFIILTTAGVLHQNGIFEISSAKEAAEALRPLAGNGAYLLFTIGMVGIGLQSIPILAGGLAYAFSEALGKPEGLSKDIKRAKFFYLAITLATLLGLLINFLKIDAIKALFYAAIFNGVAAVPLLVMILVLANKTEVVGRRKSSGLSNVIMVITIGLMFLAATFMIKNLLG